MKMELMEDVYKQKLAELFDAERQLLQFLPKMSKAVANDEMRTLLEKHTQETKIQCERLEKLLATRGVQLTKKSRAMRGILAESKDLLKQRKSADPEILTLALSSAAQDVEGYEINGYACAHTYARLLGFHDDLKPIEATFEEEKKMEESLMKLAESLNLEGVESEAPVQQHAVSAS